MEEKFDIYLTEASVDTIILTRVKVIDIVSQTNFKA